MVAPSQATVSLCMIVRNEERNLSDCLAPVAGLFDEIVIVDTGSHDATKAIAARFTNQIFDFAWCDDFSAARNESLRRSRGDWIFWLDADDRVGPEHVGGLRNVLEGLGDRPQTYFMDTVLHGQYESEGPHLLSHPRLIRRHPNLHWRGRVHEQIRPDLTQLGYEMVWTDIQIDHLGYKDPTLRQRKLQRDIRLLRMDYAVDPNDSSTLLHLGLTYAEMANHAEARKHLIRLLGADDCGWDCMGRVYHVLADMSLRDGKFEEALFLLARGLAKFPHNVGLLFAQANVFFEMGRYDAARGALAQIANAPKDREHHGVPSDIRHKLAPCKLADILRMQGRHDEAERTLHAVIQDYPADSYAWYALGCVYGDRSQKEQLDAVIERLQVCPEGEIFAGVLRASWHLRHSELQPAGEIIDDLIAKVPHVSLPRLLRCQWLDLIGAPLESRIQACHDLLRVQPGNPDALAALQVLENARSLVSAPSAAQWCTSVMVGSGVLVAAPAA